MPVLCRYSSGLTAQNFSVTTGKPTTRLMNRASCLSLLSNAVLVYNTSRMAPVLEHATAQGQEFTHVIGNGTYDFSPPQANGVEEKLCV